MTTEECLKMQELERIIKHINQLPNKEEFIKEFHKRYGVDISILTA